MYTTVCVSVHLNVCAGGCDGDAEMSQKSGSKSNKNPVTTRHTQHTTAPEPVRTETTHYYREWGRVGREGEVKEVRGEWRRGGGGWGKGKGGAGKAGKQWLGVGSLS